MIVLFCTQLFRGFITGWKIGPSVLDFRDCLVLWFESCGCRLSPLFLHSLNPFLLLSHSCVLSPNAAFLKGRALFVRCSVFCTALVAGTALQKVSHFPLTLPSFSPSVLFIQCSVSFCLFRLCFVLVPSVLLACDWSLWVCHFFFSVLFQTSFIFVWIMG